MHQKLLVPLFGVEVAAPLHFSVTEAEFIDRLVAHIYPKPIRLGSGEKPPADSEATSIPIPPPVTTIRILPWARSGAAYEDATKLFSVSLLPMDFDLFDDLGSVALRPGSGGLGGFQTVTMVAKKKVAGALLVMEFDQTWPDGARTLMSSTNPYESRLAESLFDGLRLFSGSEPHPHKGFHITDGQLMDIVIKWPLSEIQGNTLRVSESDLPAMKQTFLHAWQIRTASRESLSCKILTLATEYYYLSSTFTETRTIFIYLMIAFEALFKTPTEDSASAASSRLARLLASTKEQHNEIRRFMWGTKKVPGCCQLRNEIIHGGVSSLRTEAYWQLRDLIRAAILQIMHLVLSGCIDRKSYYQSLFTFVDQRFGKLPSS